MTGNEEPSDILLAPEVGQVRGAHFTHTISFRYKKKRTESYMSIGAEIGPCLSVLLYQANTSGVREEDLSHHCKALGVMEHFCLVQHIERLGISWKVEL